ncbi:single-stranded DNA-binding protein [bacterium]|nr:single-stranded DNA-binding protein [candidate division CSSED10-310 bacterium]
MFNLVVLIGNLGADPEIRTTPSGIKVAKMRLAVNDTWTNRQSGEREQRTNWIDLNAWDRLAQTAERYLSKGQRICVRGSLEYREWQGQDNQKRSKLEVRVRELFMLSARDTAGPARSQAPDEPGPARGVAAGGNYPGHAQGSRNEPPFDSYDDQAPLEDDDIPF